MKTIFLVVSCGQLKHSTYTLLFTYAIDDLHVIDKINQMFSNFHLYTDLVLFVPHKNGTLTAFI